MTTYTAIVNTEIDKDSPLTAPVMTRLRDNPLALSEGNGPAVAAGEIVVLCLGHGSGDDADPVLWSHSEISASASTYSSEDDHGRGSVTIYRAGVYRVRFAGIGDGGTTSANNSYLTLYRKPTGLSAVSVGSIVWPTTSDVGYVPYNNSGDDYIDVTVASGDHFYFLASCRNNGTSGPVFLSFSTDQFFGPVGA